MKNIDVIALGELLIDFTESGFSDQGNRLFEANPGGAPCNVLAMLQNLGHNTAFIGKIGKDSLGYELKQKVENIGIDISHLAVDHKVHTTLAFVHTYVDGDRDFSFYRNPGADMLLNESEIDEAFLKKANLFHFGTLSMTHKMNRGATVKALNIAKNNGLLISFDPNIRESLWDDLEEAKKQTEYGLSYCDILKISDNEIQWLTGEKDYSKGVEQIRSRYNIQLILVSMGKEGSRAYYKDIMVESKPFLHEHTIETTGAGDTFCGCILHHILKWGLNDLEESQIREMLTFANVAASIITTRKGALCVMPKIEEIRQAVLNSWKIK